MNPLQKLTSSYNQVSISKVQTANMLQTEEKYTQL